MPEQNPVEQFAVGGQSTITGLIVLEETDGFEEDVETKLTTAGQFKADVVYSRRKTKSLSIELSNTATITHYVEGGYVDAAFAPAAAALAVWEIRSVSQTRTRGAVQLELELVSLSDEVT